MYKSHGRWSYNEETKHWETTQKCFMCRGEVEIALTNVQFAKYAAGTELIQRIRPEIDVDTREFLISGICSECFNRITKED